MTNRAGYTLIEVLVSFALVSLIVGAMGAIFQTSFKGANLVEMRNSAVNLNMAWQTSLNKPDICEKNFKGITFNADGLSALTSFVDMTNKPMIAPGVKSTSKNLLVKSVSAKIRDQNWNDFQAAKASLGTNTYIANIDIDVELERQKDQISSKDSSLAVSIPVYLNAAGAVDGCLSSQAALMTDAQKEACEQLGGTFDEAASQCNFKQDCDNLVADSVVSKECFDKLTDNLSNQVKDIGSATTTTQKPKAEIHKTIKACLSDSQGATIAANNTSCVLGSTTFSATPTEFIYRQGATSYSLTDPVLAKYLYDLVTKYQTDSLTKITVGDK
ncbi:type II secretion system protein [Bdellovibrio sp. HCB209]|uniref:type II secretion system protein n=1 Tax=Bdellovibrio sp. HCB209 TaxID=3394354 RepID=UPI0039B580B2